MKCVELRKYSDQRVKNFRVACVCSEDSVVQMWTPSVQKYVSLCPFTLPFLFTHFCIRRAHRLSKRESAYDQEKEKERERKREREREGGRKEERRKGKGYTDDKNF